MLWVKIILAVSILADKIRHKLAAAASDLETYAEGLLVYAAILALCYAIGEARMRGVTFKSMLRYIFRPDLLRNRTVKVDFLSTLFYFGFWGQVVGTLGRLLAGISVCALLVKLSGRPFVLADTGWWVVAIQFMCMAFIADLGQFLIHYWAHKVPLLWSLHRVHHSAEAETVFATFRAHPLETICHASFSWIFTGIGMGIVLFIFAGKVLPEAAALYLVFGFAAGPVLVFFQHSHTRISFGWLNNIIAAPVMHHIHHSAELRHRDKNMGFIFSIWDRLFGTIYLPAKHESYRWGLNDEEIGDRNPHLRLRDFYLEPFSYAWKVIRGGGEEPSPETSPPAAGPASLG